VRRRRQRAGDVHVRHGRRQSPHATAISGRRRRTSGREGRPTVSGSSYDEVAAREGCGIEPTAADRIRGIAIQQFGSKDRREMAVNLILPITLVVRLDQPAHRACSYINKRVRAMTFKINDL